MFPLGLVCRRQQKENKKKKLKQRTHLEWSSGRYNRVMGHKLGPFNSSRANITHRASSGSSPPNVSCRLSLLPAFVAYIRGATLQCKLLEIIWKRPSVRPFDRGQPGGSQSWPHDGKVSGPRRQPHVCISHPGRPRNVPFEPVWRLWRGGASLPIPMRNKAVLGYSWYQSSCRRQGQQCPFGLLVLRMSLYYYC